MPINVFGNSNSNDNGNKIDTSLFVQKPYLKHNYIEANIEEDIDLKNQFRIKNLLDPISIREAASKYYVDNLFNNSSIVKNALLDPISIREAASKNYVDNLFNNSSIVKNAIYRSE